MLLKDAEENDNVTNWVSLVKNMLFKHGFGNVWVQQYVPNENSFLSIFTQRINDISLQTCNENINNVSDHRLYKHLGVETASYLTKINERYLRNAIAKIRLGSHNFYNERGKWQCPKIEYTSRLCTECDEIEDEFHIILQCKRFNQLRKRYLPKELYERQSMYTFIDFINNVEGKQLKMFGLFCFKAMCEYNTSET